MGVRDFLTFFDLGYGGQTPQRTFRQSGSNDVFSRKDVPFAVKVATFHTPYLQAPYKVKILQIFGLRNFSLDFGL